MILVLLWSFENRKLSISPVGIILEFAVSVVQSCVSCPLVKNHIRVSCKFDILIMTAFCLSLLESIQTTTTTATTPVTSSFLCHKIVTSPCSYYCSTHSFVYNDELVFRIPTIKNLEGKIFILFSAIMCRHVLFTVVLRVMLCSCFSCTLCFIKTNYFTLEKLSQTGLSSLSSSKACIR